MLPSLYGYALVGHFYSVTCKRNDRCACAVLCGVIGHYCEKTSGVCELLFVLLIMPPRKVCPQGQAVVPPRQTLQRQSAPALLSQGFSTSVLSCFVLGVVCQ